MHIAQPSMVQEAAACAGLGAADGLIAGDSTDFYYRHSTALPNHEVAVKNCKAVSKFGKRL
jgi:hypothetical protein